MHHEYSIRELVEPKGLLGTKDKAVLLLRKDKSNIFSDEELHLLDSIRFSNGIISDLDFQVCRNNKNFDEVANEWFKSKGNPFLLG